MFIPNSLEKISGILQNTDSGFSPIFNFFIVWGFVSGSAQARWWDYYLIDDGRAGPCFLPSSNHFFLQFPRSGTSTAM